MDYRLFVFLLTFGLVTSFGAGCGDTSPKPVRPSVEVVKTTKKALTTEELRVFLQEVLGPVGEIRQEEDGYWVQLGQPMAEEDLAQIMVPLGLKAPEKIPGAKSLRLEGRGLYGTKLKAQYALSDAKAFMRGEISKPEWIRRTQIGSEETKESLTLKIREKALNHQTSAAIPWLRQLLEKDPGDFSAWALLGNALRDTQDESGALDIFARLMTEPGYEFFASWNMAYCQEKLGLIDQSIASYRRALDLDPDHPVLLRQIAVAYLKKGQTAEARNWHARYKALEPGDLSLWIEALILRQEKKYKEAREVLSKVVGEGSSAEAVLFDKILLDLDLKDFDAAKRKFVELKNRAPELAQELGGVSVFENL